MLRKFLYAVLGGLVLVFAGLLIASLIPRESLQYDYSFRKKRPPVRAARHMAAAGSPQAAQAALRILNAGGNAFDAAAAALLVLNVTNGEAAAFAGIAPLMIHDAASGRTRSYIGAGTAPARATIKLFREAGHETVPRNSILAQLLPASPDVIFALLADHGTLSFEAVSRDAVRLAADGFPVNHITSLNLDLNMVKRLGYTVLMPYNAKVYLNGEWWRPLRAYNRLTRPDLARTFIRLGRAEQKARAAGGSRRDGLRAARDYFYKGPIASEIIALHEKKGGLFTRKDLANYRGAWEQPLTGRFGEFEIRTHRTWSQGAALPMILQMLEGVDLRAMGHNSPEYMHAVLQAIELTMADREAYFGDPAFVKVPEREMLSRSFAQARRSAMTPGRAFGKMPAPGRIAGFVPSPLKLSLGANASLDEFRGIALNRVGKDTSYVAVVDAKGNAVSLTPSDFPMTPMVPGTGITLGNRMTQFRLDPAHAAALAPGKRPRITPNAALVYRKGRLYMTFGTPGGDMQIQALVQVFLNHLVWGMDIQKAIEAPRFKSRNWPDSFAPHEYKAGVIELENELASRAPALEKLGYKVKIRPSLDNRFSAVCAITREDGGGLIAGADPREESLALGK